MPRFASAALGCCQARRVRLTSVNLGYDPRLRPRSKVHGARHLENSTFQIYIKKFSPFRLQEDEPCEKKAYFDLTNKDILPWMF